MVGLNSLLHITTKFRRKLPCWHLLSTVEIVSVGNGLRSKYIMSQILFKGKIIPQLNSKIFF